MNQFFITGTGRGLGKALAEELLKDENNMVNGISRQQTIHHANYRHYFLDLTDLQLVHNFQFEIHEHATKIALINNAGLLGEIKHIGELDGQAIINTYNVNTVAPALLTNNFIKAFKNLQVEKLIIGITSGAAQKPYDGWSIYCSSKAAIDMLARVGDAEQKVEGLKYPFKFLSIAPGVMDTDMQAQIRESNVNAFSSYHRFVDLKKEGKLIRPEDVAKEYVRIINDPSIVEGVIHRIEL